MDLIDESKGIDWLDGFKKTNKQKNNIWCLPASHFSFEVTTWAQSEEMEKIFHAIGNHKSTGVPILMSDKIDVKPKMVTRDREGHYIMINGSIHQEDITIIDIYAPNIGAPKCIKKY